VAVLAVQRRIQRIGGKKVKLLRKRVRPLPYLKKSLPPVKKRLSLLPNGVTKPPLNSLICSRLSYKLPEKLPLSPNPSNRL
jgi:hypothetical protein